MFGNLFKSSRNSEMAGKVAHILLKSYSLSASPDDVMRVVSQYSEITNEFEMTLMYLTDWVGRMYVDHPKGKSEVEKYIRITHALRERGYIQNQVYVDTLFKAIEKRFLIDAKSVARLI